MGVNMRQVDLRAGRRGLYQAPPVVEHCVMMNCKPADDTVLPTETALPLKKFPHVMFGPRLELLLGYAPGQGSYGHALYR